eukprot:4103441-Pyramimonas_sp.AAC.1
MAQSEVGSIYRYGSENVHGSQQQFDSAVWNARTVIIFKRRQVSEHLHDGQGAQAIIAPRS